MRKDPKTRLNLSGREIARIGKRIDIPAQKLYKFLTNLSAVGEKEVFDG